MSDLRPRRSVEKMAPYRPPTAGRAGKLRLDFNENTVGCSPRVIEFLQSRLDGGSLSVYPEYVDAREEIARFFDVDPSEFTFTNGTDEAIQVLVNTYVDSGDDVILLHPSYAMYRFYTEVAGGNIREIPYRPSSLDFPLEELTAAVLPTTRVIFISNPNNPTGSATGLPGIQRILEAAPHAAVFVDEAYFEFYGVTALPWIRRYANLFVSRTFSKVYGMAAMRIGCLFSSAGNQQYLRKCQSPYSVNSLAVLAARAAIRDTEYVRSYVAEALAARDMLYAGFEEMGVRYYKSCGNFVLFHAGDQAAAVRDSLRDRGILVRDRSYEIPGTVRVTAGTREQTTRFLEGLKEIWR